MSFDWFNDPLLPTIIISCVAHIARYSHFPPPFSLVVVSVSLSPALPLYVFSRFFLLSSISSSFSLPVKPRLLSTLPLYLLIVSLFSLSQSSSYFPSFTGQFFSTLFLSISFFHPSSLLSRFSLLFPSRCTALLFPYFFFAVSSVCKQNNLIEWKRVCLFATRKRIRRKRAYVQKVAKTVA